jgi:Spy/CpxP family protein refolding chaperone
MTTLRKQVLLVALTALAAGAGTVGGLLMARGADAGAQAPPSPAPPGDRDRTPLVEDLQLTPDQREQMRVIWEGVRHKAHAAYEDAQRLQKQRDEAIIRLLNDEQKAQFEKISKDHAQRFDELRRRRDETFESGVEQTKKLLDDTQRQKYDQILKTHVRRDPLGYAPLKTKVE